METVFSHPKIYFSLVALCFDFMLVGITLVHGTSENQGKNFLYMVFICTMATLCDVLRVFSIDFPGGPVWDFVRNALYSVSFIASTGISYSYTAYLTDFVNGKDDGKKWLRRVNTLIFWAYAVFMLVNVFTKVVCSYDSVSGTWVRGPLYLAMGYVPAVYFLVSASFFFLVNMNLVNKRVRLTMYFAIGAALVAIFLQPLTHGQISLSPFGASVGVFLWYFSVENADYKSLVDALKALESARAQAVEANRAKSAFLANMSHEIRTPMNAVLGLTDMILHSDNDEEIMEYAKDIQSSGKSLLSIINGVLDFSKLESGRMELTEGDYHLSTVLHEINVQMGLRAAASNLTYRTDFDGSLPNDLYGDQVKLRQIIVNLLNNAIKYTREGGVVFTLKGSTRRNRLMLHIEIEDTGIGIRESDLSSLFESFERVDEKRNRSIEGTGLGLAIVQRLVRLMGGTISVKSEYGKGSVFTVDIPQKVVGDRTLEACKSSWDEDNAGETECLYIIPDAKILIVDDNSVNLLVAKGLLKKTQAQITTCESGFACLELMKKIRFDVIFLDHLMPEMDGVETLQRAHGLPGNLNRFTPVVALTANAIAGMRERYLSLGFSDYVSKPIDSHHLYDVLFRCISNDLLVKVQKDEEKQSDDKEYETVNSLIDQSKGMELCGNDKDLYKMLLEEFISSAEENMSRLENFYREKKWKDYRVLVHALKSNGRQIGCESFSQKAFDLETASRNIMEENAVSENEAFIQKNHPALISFYKFLVDAVKKLC